MDGTIKNDCAPHAIKHHHESHKNSADFEDDVHAAHDAWAAWKSHDPAAWDAALDLRDRIGGKAWRHAMHEVDKEEAAHKRECKDVLPPVTIHEERQERLGGIYQYNSAENYSQAIDRSYYPQPNYGGYSLDVDRYYPEQNNGSYYGAQQFYPQQNYSTYYGAQQSGWMGPTLGGGAVALFHGHNRWHGTEMGAVLGSMIQGATMGNFGFGINRMGRW